MRILSYLIGKTCVEVADKLLEVGRELVAEFLQGFNSIGRECTYEHGESKSGSHTVLRAKSSYKFLLKVQ